ncbi:MAG: hypothetical protein GY953_25450, partial [bacterium]|nr:hypothetical protein [bacterium]
MFEEIERFYESTKVRKLATVGGDGEVPITHLQVFHKRYPRLPRVALPPVEAGGELSELLRRRKSSRKYSGAAIRLRELSEILESCRIVETTGGLERRTYPSAGARFPVEVYPI